MTNLPDDQSLRLRCLELAISAQAIDPVERAADFHAFITGQPAKTPREQILAALEAADVR